MSVRQATKDKPDLEVDYIFITLRSVNTTIETACLSPKPYLTRSDPIKDVDYDDAEERRKLEAAPDPALKFLLRPLENVVAALDESAMSIHDWAARVRYTACSTDSECTYTDLVRYFDEYAYEKFGQ